MIELFHSIMRSRAAVSHRTFEVSCAVDYVRAYLTSVGTKGSSSILLGFVVEEAFLWIVLVWDFTLLSLEVIEIDEADDIIRGPPINLSLEHTSWENC